MSAKFDPIYAFNSWAGCDWVQTDLALSKKVLGGKGQALVAMINAGMNVPPGLTITTEQCNIYRTLSGDEAEKFLDNLMTMVLEELALLKNHFGYMPLFSVRSGAPISMPGMMDTILNVGLTHDNVSEWQDRIGERATIDSFRRLVQMLGTTAYDVPHGVFEFQLAGAKKLYGVKEDTDLTADMLDNVLQRYFKAFKENYGFEFPDTSFPEQLRAAIRAVFESWMNPRAIEYRKINGISEDMGTAVTVQAMVFGNMGEDSGSGVLFTRDPSTGYNAIMGEYLANAQGEDVVAGIRTPIPLNKVPAAVHTGDPVDGYVIDNGKWLHELSEVCDKLELHYKDMVDVEFTVQKGELFILQSRVGKRSAIAAVKIAMDMLEEKLITEETALKRITAEQYKLARRPQIGPGFKVDPTYVGLAGCPGVVTGKPVFSAEDAVNCTEPCILVTKETTPDDIAGMNAAVGILTQTGGATSHAAVVARAMNKPCIVGCTDMSPKALYSAKKVTLDGITGRVWVDIDVPVVDASADPSLTRLQEVCRVHGGYDRMEDLIPDDMGPEEVVVVTSVNWWGDVEALLGILDELKEMPHQQRARVVLDVTSPYEALPVPDRALVDMFGDVMDMGFPSDVYDALDTFGPNELSGLLIVGLPGPLSPTAEATGVYTLGKPKVVADLFKGTTAPDDEFIKNIIGGHDAWKKLKVMLEGEGYSPKSLPSGVPADYAVFKALKA